MAWITRTGVGRMRMGMGGERDERTGMKKKS